MATLKQKVYSNVREETEAHNGYMKLAKQLKEAGKGREARSVRAIAKDEADHHRILKKIQSKM